MRVPALWGANVHTWYLARMIAFAVFSLSIYFVALDATNRVSVRLHRNDGSSTEFEDELQRRLFKMEKNGLGTFVPLTDNLTGDKPCISIGINGKPDAACSGFSVRAS